MPQTGSDTATTMVTHRPHPSLRGLVRRTGGFTERQGGPQHRRELPFGGVPIILSFGDRVRISSATGSGEYTSFLAGVHEIPVDTSHDGSLRCIQVDLSPLGAYQLLGLPMSELHDTVAPLDALDGARWRDLGDRLAELPSWSARFELVDDTLCRAAADGRTADPEVRWAWRRLVASHGTAPIGPLAAEVGWSRRHFAARFRCQVGLAPKPAAQVLRFAHAHALLTAPGAGSISDVAAAAGYADHSHLTREFRRLAGTTPS
ncbi:MAG TPA: helix-turn-helix domain-containing protein, partial [Pseudonocardia sp.]|nr:helix-turn-helix domain-containing protein [Pseudonocardia sp.]